MKQYVELLKRVLSDGERRDHDRTGVGTLAVFGGRVEFDLREAFPLVSVKRTNWQAAFAEMLWFLSGKCYDVQGLHEMGVHLWDAWADECGDLGPIYGVQWRNWCEWGMGIDQIAALVEGLRSAPQSRRHLVSAWNVAALPEMALPPCHWAFQCYVSNSGELDLQVNQRSWDLALGAPFNIAQYALLAHLLARAAHLRPRRLSFSFGDAHLYLNHVEAMREVIETRAPVETAPRLVVSTMETGIDGYALADFAVEDYHPHPFVKLPIAV